MTIFWEDQSNNRVVAVRKNEFHLEQLLLWNTQDSLLEDYSQLLDIDAKVTHLLARDFRQMVFVGTLDGLLKVVYQNRAVQSILKKEVAPGKWGFAMHGMIKDAMGHIYMAREVSRWYRYDPVKETLDTIQIQNPEDGTVMDFQCSYQLLIDQQQNLWGSSCNGDQSHFYLHRYHIPTKTLTSYSYPLTIHTLYQTRDGQLWVAAGLYDQPFHSILSRFDVTTQTFIDYRNADGSNPLEGRLPRYLHEAQDGTLWVGTLNGLVAIDRSQQESRIYTKIENNNGGILQCKEILVISEGPTGILYLGTSNGLHLFDPKTNAVKVYTQADGLCNNQVCGVLMDEHSGIWLSTFNGLSYFDPVQESFINFNTADGFHHDEFNRFSFLDDQQGQFYFGSMNGVNAFKATELLMVPDPPPLQLTKLTHYNARTDSLHELNYELDKLNKIVLSPHDTYFRLDFSIPDFQYISRNQYQVKLEGYDQNWQNLGNTSFVRYNQLPSGNYTLLLKGFNSKIDAHTPPIKIGVRVRQKIYKTPLFIIACIGIVLSLFYARYRSRINQLLQIERLRTKIASDLHDEVGSIMTRISMGADLLQANAFDEIERQKELHQIATQSRKATSIMSDIVWSIDARRDSMQDLVDRMREHMHEMLTPLNIQHKLETIAIPFRKKLNVAVRQNIYFIFKEAINNIAKHSDANQVNVILQNDSEFTLSIQDNGNQKNPTFYSGQGLKNMAMRAERLKGNLNINTTNGYHITLRLDTI